ncbi:MAG: hypothetical protein CM1200mP2_40610 [Planctomycetaceae bacterium]|nr:MAG: hypothetical protein CM1200mP2_40610 [Planctomycetaceae bacterium]
MPAADGGSRVDGGGRGPFFDELGEKTVAVGSGSLGKLLANGIGKRANRSVRQIVVALWLPRVLWARPAGEKWHPVTRLPDVSLGSRRGDSTMAVGAVCLDGWIVCMVSSVGLLTPVHE